MFFPNQTAASTAPAPSTTGHQLLATAAPPIMGSEGGWPRVYDLRHAHVVEVFVRWTRAGHDPQALLASLSLHLGHANPPRGHYMGGGPIGPL